MSLDKTIWRMKKKQLIGMEAKVSIWEKEETRL